MTRRNSENKYKNYAILVLSCDKYSDLWKPFFSQFRKFWPQCPFKVYLGSNTKKYNDSSVKTILSVTNEDWSSDLLKILSNLKEEYIFLWVDDFFPIGTVDTKPFLRCFQFMETTHANHIHMAPLIHPDGYYSDGLFGYYEKGAPYRVIVAGFWNKRHLQTLLLPGESPWKFEIMASYRSSYSDGYYSINKPLFQLIRIVEKGKISRQAYTYCMENNIELDVRNRPIFTVYEEIISNIQGLIFHTVLHIPWKIRTGLMETLRRLIVSY